MPVSDSPTIDGTEKEYRNLLLIGNFMQYFVLMLAVHMAFVLNKVFLPQDTGYEHILRPLTFLMPLCVQPFAALIWGTIGDRRGRKTVIAGAILYMSVCSLALAVLPTYAQWGIVSSICFLILISVQSILTSGENAAVDVYIAETVPAPQSYFSATLAECSCSFGSLLACLVGWFSLLIDPVGGWKTALTIGVIISALGFHVRRELQETDEFLNFCKKQKDQIVINIEQKKHMFRNILAEGLTHTYVGMFFYVQFAYLPSILEKQFGWNNSKILLNSACLLIMSVISEIVVGRIALKVNPVKIIKFLYISAIPFCLLFSTRSSLLSCVENIIFIQAFFYIFAVGVVPLIPMFVRAYPINHRLKSHMWGLALVKVIAFVLTAFVCERFDNINILFLVMAAAAAVSLFGAFLFKPYHSASTNIKTPMPHFSEHEMMTQARSEWHRHKQS